MSYHWLWIVPRELARRSRTVPYQDGIRTELGRTVTPGGAAIVQGRLLAPTVPGLYWLQWDMVEEGVTWFAQVSPRQPRQLVIVLPTLAGFFAPLPLLVALFGTGAFSLARRGRPLSHPFVGLVAVADVLWCAVALFSKPLILVREVLLEPTPVAYGLTVVAALVPPVLFLALLPRRVRAGVLFACGAFGTLVILADTIYYRFFGDVLSVPVLAGARQTGQVWGSIRSLLTFRMIWLVLDIPFALWLIISLTRARSVGSAASRRQRLAAAIALLALGIAGARLSAPVVRAGELDQMYRDRAVMQELGPFGYHAYDAWSYARSRLFRPRATPDQVAEMRAWFADRAPLRAGVGPYFGAAAGANLIVVQVESLQDFVVDYRVDGQEVMPHLRRWKDDGLRFTNVTDQTSEGRTSDAEFAALVSLLPLDHGAVAFQYSGNHYVGLPRVLTEHGYATLSAVPFAARFWNRRVTHPSYGFERSLFDPDFELTEEIGWGLNDRDFLRQMVPRLARLPRPFGAWLITLSLHHPFDGFPDHHKVLKLGSLEHTSFGNYLHTMHFFDQALEDFKAALARAGLLDATLLAVFGDHDAGFARDPWLAGTIGIGTGDAAWEQNDRVPFLVRVPGQTGGRLSGALSIPAGQTDFAPTLLSLLGIDSAPLPYVGRNLLGNPDDPPIPRPYGNWLDSTHLFISPTTSDRSSACYALSRAVFVDESACRATNEIARRSRDIARLVVIEDLQQRLRDALR